MRFFGIVLAIIVACDTFARAQQTSTQPAAAAAVSDDAFDTALEKAAGAGPGSAEFVAALQSVAGRFANVEPATEPGKGSFQNVTLNTRGKKIDAFRFRVPEGERRDLFWAVAFPKNMKSWYISPAEGPAKQGFTSFQKTPPARMFKGKPPANLTGGVLQALAGEHLEPGREYLMWFIFEDDKPGNISLAMALLPSKGEPDNSGAVKALGLPLPPATQPAPGATPSKPGSE